jgi:hypothetical protein
MSLAHYDTDCRADEDGPELPGHAGPCVACENDECGRCVLCDSTEGGCDCDRCSCCKRDRVRCVCVEACNESEAA